MELESKQIHELKSVQDVLTMPKPSSIFPGPSRSEVFCPGNVHTDNATPIVPTSPATRRASAATSTRGRPAAATAPAT